MVFAATRRRRALGLEGKMIGAAAASSVGARKGFSTGEADSSAGAELRFFLTSGGRQPRSLRAFRGSRLRRGRRRRRSACSWPQGSCGPSLRPRRRIGAGRCRRAIAPAAPLIGLAPEQSAQDGRPSPSGAGADVADGLYSAAAAGRSRAATRSLSAAPALLAASAFAPSARSGASRSSSPAMPTRVKRA